MISMNQGYAFILFGEENMEYQIQLLCTYMQEIMNSKETGMEESAGYFQTSEN